MKKINKIWASLVLVCIAYGIYAFNQLQIFDSVQIQADMSSKARFKSVNQACYVNEVFVPPLEKSHFRLLSWNIHKGADVGWQQDLARFTQEQDFVLLQEATPQQKINGFSTALFVSSFAYQGNASGVKTFAHSTPQTYCAFSQVEPWIRIPKVASAVKFPLKNGGELLVINAHLINFEWQPKAYQKQLEQIFLLINEHKSAVVLGGDFNAWNEERKQQINTLAKQYGLQEVTFSKDERVRFWGNPLDYVFVRGMNVLSSKTEKVTSSDHSPIWVELELL